MNTIIIPFISYSHFDKKLGQMLHDYVLSKISKFPCDNFIFVGTHMSWKNEIVNIHGKTIEYIPTGECHQENLQIAISKLKDDDKFVIMDSDLMIYDYSIFSRIFDDLDQYDIVSNIDGGCTITPTYFHIWQKGHFPEDAYRNFMYTSPIFAPNEYRGGKGRFAATLFGCTKKFWMKHCGEIEQYNTHESMEIFSRNVIKNTPDVKFKELLDYRCNVWTDNQNTIGTYINSDDTRCDEVKTMSGEYYHIRNFGETIKAVEYLMTNRSYVHHNKQESWRLLAWFTIVLEKLVEIDSSYSVYTSYIDKIRRDSDISTEFFAKYLEKFKEFHRTNML